MAESGGCTARRVASASICFILCVVPWVSLMFSDLLVVLPACVISDINSIGDDLQKCSDLLDQTLGPRSECTEESVKKDPSVCYDEIQDAIHKCYQEQDAYKPLFGNFSDFMSRWDEGGFVCQPEIYFKDRNAPSSNFWLVLCWVFVAMSGVLCTSIIGYLYYLKNDKDPQVAQQLIQNQRDVEKCIAEIFDFKKKMDKTQATCHDAHVALAAGSIKAANSAQQAMQVAADIATSVSVLSGQVADDKDHFGEFVKSLIITAVSVYIANGILPFGHTEDWTILHDALSDHGSRYNNSDDDMCRFQMHAQQAMMVPTMLSWPVCAGVMVFYMFSVMDAMNASWSSVCGQSILASFVVLVIIKLIIDGWVLVIIKLIIGG